ncbi:MAG TPA: sulfite exporter TauE/SafE family protein [Opitutaceae bacterium]|nr:sulfite exporter TauE/SafE family protein [Opitutaceae bacterium]
MNLHGWDWALAILGALLVGVAKTGITGLSLLFVALFAAIMPAKQSTGVVLPLLVLGDIVAFLLYRRHANWSHIWRLVPWAAAGVIIGFFALGHMNDHQSRLAIGIIVVALAALHIARRAKAGAPPPDYPAWFAGVMGILAGFTSLVSNAAGPLMVIYLLAMRLPKMEYMGTGAAFFLMMNLFKLPFMVDLGLVNQGSLGLNLILAPAVIAGTVVGRWLLGRIDQRLFENVALGLTLVAGARMFL